MATIPLWLLGRNVSSVVITPQIADSGGVLSNAALGAVTITTTVDEIGYSGRRTTQEISALTATRRHNMEIERDDSLVLTQIMRAAAGSNTLAAAWTGGDAPDWALVSVTRGGNTIAFIGLMVRLEETVAKGKSVARLTLAQISTPGTDNPDYT